MIGRWQAGMILVTEARTRFEAALDSGDLKATRTASDILQAQVMRQCMIPALEWPQFGWKTLRAEVLSDPLIIAVLEADEARLSGGAIVAANDWAELEVAA